MKKSGAVNFIIHKIRAKNHPVSIAESLARMGYTHIEISETFIEAGRSIDKLHQELIAGNDFLPTLNEDLESYFKEGNLKIFKGIIIENPTKSSQKQVFLKTLFPYPAPAPMVVDHMKRNKGIRVTRHVFAFRFLYVLSMAVLGIILGYLFIKLLEPQVLLNQQIDFNYWKNTRVSAGSIGVILLLLVFGMYVFQLFVRRLHNAGMSAWLSLLIFSPFLSLVPGLTEVDKNTVFYLSYILVVSVFMIAVLTPTHRYRI